MGRHSLCRNPSEGRLMSPQKLHHDKLRSYHLERRTDFFICHQQRAHTTSCGRVQFFEYLTGQTSTTDVGLAPATVEEGRRQELDTRKKSGPFRKIRGAPMKHADVSHDCRADWQRKEPHSAPLKRLQRRAFPLA